MPSLRWRFRISFIKYPFGIRQRGFGNLAAGIDFRLKVNYRWALTVRVPLINWTRLVLCSVQLSVLVHILELGTRNLVGSFISFNRRADVTGAISLQWSFGHESRSDHRLNVLTSVVLAADNRDPFLIDRLLGRLLSKILLNENCLIGVVDLLLLGLSLILEIVNLILYTAYVIESMALILGLVQDTQLCHSLPHGIQARLAVKILIIRLHQPRLVTVYQIWLRIELFQLLS